MKERLPAKRRPWVLVATTLLAILMTEGPARTEQPPALATPPGGGQRSTVNYAKLPLSFEANQGQTDPQVKFLSRGPGYTLFLTADEAVLRLKGAEQPAMLRLKLVGANPSPEVTGLEELPGRSNHFLGNDPAKWRTNVPHFARVRFEDVYPGIDLVYYGTEQGQLEYDFIVHPGADPSTIRLEVDGADHLHVADDGNLVMHLSTGEIRLRRAVVYQEAEAGRVPIPGRYALSSKRRVAFQLGAYDSRRTLVIDPVLVYSTYLGGFNDDRGHDIATDNEGNAYVTGVTISPNFPTQNALQPMLGSMADSGDAFITKLNPAGSALVYSTYLGGSDLDQSRSISVDASGNVYVTGFTASTSFPTTMGAFDTTLNNDEGTSDTFVAKLNASGSALLYSTYIGGSGPEEANSLAVDLSGNAYITGGTASSDFPTTNGAFDTTPGQTSFVTKLNATGSALVYSTYLGGSAFDLAHGIAVDGAGNAYITGLANSTDFPTTPGAFDLTCGTDGLCNGIFTQGDGFATKLNSSGSALVYSTYLGGSGSEEAADIAIDPFGAAYITGITNSLDFPTVKPLQSACNDCMTGGFDAFLTKLNPAGSALEYSTYLGGNGQDWVQAIVVDAQRNAYITGATTSTDFPLANPIQGSFAGAADHFISRVSRSGSFLAFSTYLGGSGSELITDGFVSGGIAVDSQRNIYVIGTTLSSDFPTVNAFQPTFGGPINGFDALVAKIEQEPVPVPALTALFPSDVSAGGEEFILTATGTDFVPDSALLWNGEERQTTFVSVVELQATIPASDIVAAGSARISVFSPPGEESNELSLNIRLRNPLPTVTALSPPGALAGGPGFLLDVDGSNFMFNSVVHWDGLNQTTMFVSQSRLQAAIPASNIVSPGTPPVTVVTPGPGGGTSNALDFNVLNMANPPPMLASIDPTEVVAGSVRDTLALTVDGSDFLNTSVVRWNGMNRLTSFINGNQLMATIPASDLVTAGAASLTVFNPAPGGGLSAPQMFTLNNPAPTLNSINPNTAMVGDPAFTLTVLGSNFVPSSVVRWNGSDRPTSFIGSNQLRAAIPASNLASPGTVPVTVFTPGPGGGSTDPVAFDITGIAIVTVPLTANDIIFDPNTQKIYASVPGSGGGIANSIARINPLTGDIEDTVFIGSEPNKLALSDNGQFLYVGLDGAAAVRRLNIATFAPGLQFSLGSDLFFGPLLAEDIEVLPGSPESVALSLLRQGVSPRHGGVAVFDNGVKRTNVTPGHTGSNVIEFPASSTILYGLNNETTEVGFRRMVIDSSGVTVQDVTPGLIFSDIEFDSGLLYSPSARVVDPAVPSVVGTFGIGFPSVVRVEPDAANGRVFYLISENGFAYQILVFDSSTFVQSGAVSLPAFSGTPRNLIRWGANGLAFNTDQGELFLLQLPATLHLPLLNSLSPGFVAPGGPGLTLTLHGANFVPSSVVRWNGADRPTTFISGTELEAGISGADVASAGSAEVRVFTPGPVGGLSNPLTFTISPFTVLAVPTNDIVFDPLTERLYASLPGTVGSIGNSIARIDPISGTIESAVLVGSEPGPLALSDDGQFLYVGLIGGGAVRRVSVASMTPGLQFSLGADGFFGARFPTDLAVPPGSPNSVAVSRRFLGVSPDSAGVALFDSGVELPDDIPQGGPLHGSPLRLTFNEDGATLYGSQGSTFARIAAGPSGLTLTDATSNLISGLDLEFASGLVYSSGGRVIDPTTLSIVGTFPGIAFDSALEPDSALNRVFFLSGNTLQAFDQSTFLQVASLSIPGVAGFPSSLIRWGADGLAFRTSGGQIFLVPVPSTMSVAETPVGASMLHFSPPAAPAIISLLPSFVIAGSETMKLGVTGENFTEESVVRWRGKALPTKFLSRTELEVELPAEALARPGEVRLTVVTPGPSGGSSKPAVLTVTKD